MELVTIDALSGLREALNAPKTKRVKLFDEKVMEPLRPFWEPFLDRMPSGDEHLHEDPALRAAKTFNFFTPDLDVEAGLAALDKLEQAGTWAESVATIEKAWAALAPETHDINLDKILFAFALGNPAKLESQGGYTGFGGMPGLVMVLAWPTDENLAKLPAAGAHELNHNIRFSFEPFHPVETTVGQYIVAEGLAEAFAAEVCGAGNVGPWASALSADQVAEVAPRFKDAIDVNGFSEIRGYIFGDWAAEKSGYKPQGLPDFAGYTVGYELVRSYLDHSGKSASEATYIPWRDVITQSEFFG
jgi:uncharacterized protein YjaZ